MLPMIESSRRSFLVGLGKFAVAAEVARHLPSSALAQEARACPPQSAWTDLAKRISGGVLRPDDPFFADVCRPNNLRYVANVPVGIARCATPADVAACVDWVKQQGIAFAVRSGGHSYAGYSTTDGLLIDLSKLAGVEVASPQDGTYKVLGGSINSLVYKELERAGRTITHGRCDTVGAAGFLLGGGIGFNMRKFGMASDLMRATDIVTPKDGLTTAGGNSELLWACRGGGGGNFGINTSFTLQTFPAGTVTVFNIVWKKDLPTVLHRLLTELASAPDDFGSKISVTLPSLQQRCDNVPVTLSILGQLHNPADHRLEDIFKSTWALRDETASEVKRNIPYWQGQDFLTETTFPYFYQEKSSYMKASAISEQAVAAMFEQAARLPGTSMPIAFKFFQVGGAINRTDATATAYVHRGFDWLFTVECNWWRPTDSNAVVQANLGWQQVFYDVANARTNAAGAFLNFPDPSLNGWEDAYYGQNYATLRKVKAEVDPGSVFKFAQAVQPLPA